MNFKNFYEPLQFYRYQLGQILKEATANSDDIDENIIKVIETIFQDLKLPRPSSGRMKHQIIKFKEINLTVRQHLFEILLKDVIAISFTHSIVPFIAQL